MEWKDYDGSTIDVYDNLADDGTPIGRPKTPASVARVPVPEFAADFLAKWLRAAGPHIRRRRRYPDMLVGRLVHQARGDERLVAARKREVGSAVHDARAAAYLHHASGSRWRPSAHDAGARAAATLSVTMEVYTHVQDAQKRDAVAKIGILGKK